MQTLSCFTGMLLLTCLGCEDPPDLNYVPDTSCDPDYGGRCPGYDDDGDAASVPAEIEATGGDDEGDAAASAASEIAATPNGACTNPSDLAIINSADTDPSAKAAECSETQCIARRFESIDSFERCVQDCMLNAALPNYEFFVSEACTNCYVGSERCRAEFCGFYEPYRNFSCLPSQFGGKGRDSADCTQCYGENACDSSFEDCSGLPPVSPGGAE